MTIQYEPPAERFWKNYFAYTCADSQIIIHSRKILSTFMFGKKERNYNHFYEFVFIIYVIVFVLYCYNCNVLRPTRLIQCYELAFL